MFDDKGQRRGFVQEPQLAVGRLAVAGVEEDAALEQIAVEVGHQRADVARRVGLRTFFELIDVAAHRCVPLGIIALVGAVVLTFPGDFDVLVGKQKFAEAWVEGKAVAAAAGGINQHSAGAVDDVAGADLLAAAAEEVAVGNAAGACLAVDGVDGADGDVHVYIGRAVNRIEDEDVVAARVFFRDGVNVFHLFGGHAGQPPGVVGGADDERIGELVEFLHLFAVDVGAAGDAHYLGETSLVDVAGDDFGGNAQVSEQAGEFAGGFGVLPLFFDDEASEGSADLHGGPCIN